MHEPLACPVEKAIVRLGIGKTTFYALLKEGRIKAFHVGRRTLIPESELQRFVAEQMRDAPVGKAA